MSDSRKLSLIEVTNATSVLRHMVNNKCDTLDLVEAEAIETVLAALAASGSEPMEMGSDAVTPLTDGIDGTPYMYAVHIDRYEAANTLAAVLAYPDSGDWHAQMRSKLAMVARGYEPNKIWGTEPTRGEQIKAVFNAEPEHAARVARSREQIAKGEYVLFGPLPTREQIAEALFEEVHEYPWSYAYHESWNHHKDKALKAADKIRALFRAPVPERTCTHPYCNQGVPHIGPCTYAPSEVKPHECDYSSRRCNAGATLICDDAADPRCPDHEVR